MNITQFLETDESNELSKMLEDFKASADKWSAAHWKEACVRYACVVTALDLFYDEDYNTLNIRDDATAEEIWGSIESWYKHNEYAAEILACEDDCWTQFESAFEEVIVD